MKNYINYGRAKGFVFICFLLFANLMVAQTAEPEKVKTEQTTKEVTFNEGDIFEGADGEKITLIKTKKLPLGYAGWKVKFEVNGHSKNLYVTEKYLKEQCKKVKDAGEK